MAKKKTPTKRPRKPKNVILFPGTKWGDVQAPPTKSTPEKPKPAPNNDLIALLNMTLEQAASGVLQSAAMVTVYADDSNSYWYASRNNALVAAAIADLEHEFSAVRAQMRRDKNKPTPPNRTA